MSDRGHPPTQNYQTGQLDRRTLLHKRYLIQRVIGQGGMGAVYQAKDLKRQGTVCAIKEMSLSMVPPDDQAQAIQNFKIEAKMLWGLNHPNLPSLIGFFSQNQRYFLVMEYIDGQTLEELLESNEAPFPERRVQGWARQICDVLEYLHSQNPPIIFRDMKPGNIMLTRDGHIKLIDFGIARFFRPTGSPDTQLLGTPGFAPPEQYGKAQTDERSDIYALGMTLFQLLTNTLSDTGFGLRDVRAINPQISPLVARALEKATALEPEERYETIAEFRRALLGEGTFIFENGDVASTVDELADLCLRYPEEASDYLAAGEIELWLHEIEEEELSRTAMRIRTSISDPHESIEHFLHVLMGRSSRLRNYNAPTIANDSILDTSASHVAVNGSRRTPSKRAASSVQVSPRTLDFGMVASDMSPPLMITISGTQGPVRGIIHPTESWIRIDQQRFDGVYTYVNVRVNSTRLRNDTHYTGTVVISPNDETQQDLLIKIEADIPDTSQRVRWARRPKTVVPDQDDEDEEDDDLLSPSGNIQPIYANQQGTAKKIQGRNQKDKYGDIHTNNAPSNLWYPSSQPIWQQRGLTIAAALMTSSLLYTLLAQHSPLPLPPDPWFIGVLASIIPASTLGALLVNLSTTWTLKETLNRTVTGMASVLLTLAVVNSIWQLFARIDLAALHLFFMLLFAALAATIGSDGRASEYIRKYIRWALLRARTFVKSASVVIGGFLGYLLTLGVGLQPFTLFGILVGMGVSAALVWHVDQFIKYTRP